MSSDEQDSQFDLQALEMSTFGSPLMQWIDRNIGLYDRCRLPSRKKKPAVRPQSILERLPSELRHKIYSYLGIPIGTKMWVPERGYFNKKTQTYYEPSPSSTVENSVKIHEISFELTYESFSWGRWNQFKLAVDESWVYDTIKRGGDFALLYVSKALRTELLDLIFNKTSARFEFELSSKPVHYNDWFNFSPAIDRRPQGGFHHMGIATSAFAHITIIHLGSDVGTGWSAQHPGRPRTSRSIAHRALTKQAKSVFFVAKYCPALVTLKLNPFLPGLATPPGLYFSPPGCRYMLDVRIKPSILESLTVALVELVQKCQHLEVLHMPQANSRHNFMGGKLPFVWFEKEGSVAHIDTYILVLTSVQPSLRTDVTREWAKDCFKEFSRRIDVR
jgi:hypothetical protein